MKPTRTATAWLLITGLALVACSKEPKAKEITYRIYAKAGSYAWYGEEYAEIPPGFDRIRVGDREFPMSISTAHNMTEISFVLPRDLLLTEHRDEIRLLAPSPCQDLELPVDVDWKQQLERDGRARGVLADQSVTLVLPKERPMPTQVYVDREGAPSAKVAIGKYELAPRRSVDRPGQALYNLACPEGRTVRIDGQKVGELPVAGQGGATNPPAYLVAVQPGRCYQEQRNGYGTDSDRDHTYPILHDAQVYRLERPIDDFFKDSPASVQVQANGYTRDPFGRQGRTRERLLPVDCPGPERKRGSSR
jgi:hypothetical protein